ncbi:hypothetical protein C8R47DRAFT_1199035 [Mycena vitilis]|nr:hypothetical protein C8R47DRAFT_1199035 [Mycena vitilis]
MSEQHSDTALSPLQKGQACFNCRIFEKAWVRRRKIKCDGEKPMCGPCSRYSVAFGDCEYTEEGPSTAQMLEKQISVLQARIEELEISRSSRLTVTVPQASGSRARPTSPRSPPPRVSPTNTMALGPLLSYFRMLFRASLFNTIHSPSDRQQTSGASVNPNSAQSMSTELPFVVLQALVHNFLHNASCFGFFLDTHAFHDAVTSSDHSTLPPVLLNVMYLWGVHLSNDVRITAYEPAILAHALRSTAGSLSGSHPRTVLHSAQASVLLAHYFLRNGRALEGRYHISAAVATVLSACLHTIRGSSICQDALPPTGDLAEEGERIGAFWRVLTLNNCWAGVDGEPSNVSYGPNGLNIDTPWPLDTRDYVERSHMLPRHSGGTVARFLANESDDANSVPALHAKAGVLLEAATRLAARFRASGIAQNEDELVALTGRIDSFAAALPPVQSKDMLVIHTIVHGANIRLHEPLVNDHLCARSSVLSAARAIVDILVKTDIPKLGVIDPVLAPLWTCTCNVLIAEVVRRRAQGEPTQGTIDGLKVVIATMQNFAGDFRFIATQLESVRRAYNHEAYIGS